MASEGHCKAMDSLLANASTHSPVNASQEKSKMEEEEKNIFRCGL
jgi:hypothetical protein